MIAAGTSLVATTPPIPNDPTLVPLLITVADLPAGWQATDAPPLTPDPIDPSAAGDPCYTLTHTFDTIYAGPHAVAAFGAGGLNLLVEMVFRMADQFAPAVLVQTYMANLAACPVYPNPGAIESTTTFETIPFPPFGVVTAAYRGTSSFGGFVTLSVLIAVGDKLMQFVHAGGDGDTTLLQQVVAIAVQRAAAVPASPALPAPPTPAPPLKPTPTLPSG